MTGGDFMAELSDFLDPRRPKSQPGVQCEKCGRFMRNAHYERSTSPNDYGDWWPVGTCGKCDVP